MMPTTPHTIMLKGDFIRKEGEASAAITPGHLVEFGGSNDLQVHSSAAGVARKAFALENDLIGLGIDDDYASGDTVQYGVFSAGAEIYAWLDGGENASLGDALVSAGDGSLAVMASNEEFAVVAYALEAADNSGESAGGAQMRIQVEAA
jgi:hypothetical protein